MDNYAIELLRDHRAGEALIAASSRPTARPASSRLPR
jgi:hypothetical protein